MADVFQRYIGRKREKLEGRERSWKEGRKSKE